jgi:hypothetical protein
MLITISKKLKHGQLEIENGRKIALNLIGKSFNFFFLKYNFIIILLFKVFNMTDIEIYFHITPILVD